MRLLLLIIMVISLTAALEGTIDNTVRVYFDLNSALRSNASSMISTDMLLFSITPPRSDTAYIGRRNYYSHQLINLGDIALTLFAPQTTSSKGYSNYVYLDNGTIGEYDNGIDILLTNSMVLPVPGPINILLRVDIPIDYSAAGTTETNTIGFTVDTNGIPAPYTPSLLAYQESLIDLSLISPPVAVNYISDGVGQITAYDGSGSLRNLKATVRFTLNFSPTNTTNVLLMYELKTGTPGWNTNSPGITAVKCIPRGSYWEADIPNDKTISSLNYIMEFVFRIDDLYYFYSPSRGWLYNIKALNADQGYTVIMNNKINPLANEITHLSFNLRSSSQVKIYIYDITGRKIKALKEGICGQGENIVTWDGRNQNGQLVSNGVYILEIDTNEYYEIKKIVVVKR